MKLRISKNTIDSLIIYMMLYYILIGIWIGIGVGFVQSMIVCLCILRNAEIIIGNYSKCSTTFQYILILIFYFVLHYFAYFERDYYLENLIYVSNCWSVLVYFSLLLITQRKWIEQHFISLSKIFNVYMCINIIVMFLQLNETYFLIDKSRITGVVYYPDYIAGFFGINGTHRLTMFSILFICLNMFIYKFKLIQNVAGLKKYMILVSACLFFLSTQNDNNTFFILYPTFIVFMYTCLYRVNYKRLYKGVFLLGGALLMAGIIISFNKEMYYEIGKRLNDIIQFYIFRNENVWDERAELLEYALNHGNGISFGRGLGSVKMYSDSKISLHWGMNSLMSYTYFMGIVPLIIYAFLHIILITQILKRMPHIKIYFFRILMLFIFLLIIQYCQVLSETNLMILYAMICSVFAIGLTKMNNEVY